MRVWERGVGETLACGTGASVKLLLVILGYTRIKSMLKQRVELLKFTDKINNSVYLIGQVEQVFTGQFSKENTSFFL